VPHLEVEVHRGLSMLLRLKEQGQHQHTLLLFRLLLQSSTRIHHRNPYRVLPEERQHLHLAEIPCRPYTARYPTFLSIMRSRASRLLKSPLLPHLHVHLLQCTLHHVNTTHQPLHLPIDQPPSSELARDEAVNKNPPT
jgi:hypothetical protein